jgi:hypothetical protein
MRLNLLLLAFLSLVSPTIIKMENILKNQALLLSLTTSQHPMYTDVVIRASSDHGSGNGNVLRAHSGVLIAHSSYLANTLKLNTSSKDIVDITRLAKVSQMKVILKYCYSGEIDEDLPDLSSLVFVSYHLGSLSALNNTIVPPLLDDLFSRLTDKDQIQLFSYAISIEDMKFAKFIHGRNKALCESNLDLLDTQQFISWTKASCEGIRIKTLMIWKHVSRWVNKVGGDDGHSAMLINEVLASLKIHGIILPQVNPFSDILDLRKRVQAVSYFRQVCFWAHCWRIC